MDEINAVYQKITVSEETKKAVWAKTIAKKAVRPKMWSRLVLSLGSIAGLCLVSLSVVYASDIREYLEKWRLDYSFPNHNDVILNNDGEPYKKVKKDLLNTDGESKTLDYAQVEKILGFKILKSNLQTSEKIIYTTYDNDDHKTIALVNLAMPEFIQDATFDISLNASFFTEDADEGYKIGTLGDATGAKKSYVGEAETKFGKVIFYTIEVLKEGSSFTAENYETTKLLSANFVVDGLKYNLSSNKEITQTQLLNIINSLT